MKKILSYIMTASLLVFLAGCAQEELIVSFGYDSEDERNLTLTLKFEEHDSRAVMTESDLMENEIKKVDLFLYPTNGTGAATVAKKALTSIVDETSTAEGFVKNDDGTVTVKIKVSSANISTLFPSGSGNKCTAYAIANGPTIGDNVTTSISGLKDMAITSNFDEVASQTPGDGIQESFVMDGEGTITLSEANGKKSLSGNIALIRAAAKITLRVAEIVSDLTEGGVKWEPEEDYMKVFFYNGVNESKLNATADDASSRFNLPFGANGIDGYTFDSSTEGEGQNVKTVYNQEIPFYSYPSDWSGDDAANEAYLVLLLPWKKEGSAQWTSFYYKIPISHVETSTSYSKMERNTHYQIDVTVGILGAEEDKGDVVLTPKYTLLNWGEQTVNATLDKAHYLVVDKKDVKVYNQNQVEIGYKASEDISVVITKIEREDLSGNDVGTTTFFPKTGETSASTVAADRKDKANKYTFMKECSVIKDAKNIILAHDLVNEDENSSDNADGYKFSNDDYDFTPYHITLLVTMNYTDGNGQPKTMTEEIKVIQYPAMYIVASQNDDYDSSNNNANRGYVYVNGYNGNPNTSGEGFPKRYVSGTNNGQQFLGTANGLTGSNKNPNMYVVTTSLFTDGEFVIGDPRTMTYESQFINNYDYNNNDGTQTTASNTNELKFSNGSRDVWRNAPALYDGDINRRLKYYYPTDASDNTINMVAPKIRVASSYSVVGSGFLYYKEAARRRCASYQEDGYPAGRWRLPTLAEGEYMVRLSAEGKIPALFTSGASYWCAHGSFIPDNTTGNVTYDSSDYKNNSSGNSVRCVYDEWYWGSDQIANKSTFTWGDAPRATTGN